MHPFRFSFCKIIIVKVKILNLLLLHNFRITIVLESDWLHTLIKYFKLLHYIRMGCILLIESIMKVVITKTTNEFIFRMKFEYKKVYTYI